MVWTAWEIFQKRSGEVEKSALKHAKFGSDYKTIKSYRKVMNFTPDHEIIKRIWQSLASYLTIKSDKKSSQQQAHELYPFLPSCSLSLSLSPNSNSEHFFLPIV